MFLIVAVTFVTTNKLMLEPRGQHGVLTMLFEYSP